MATMRVKEETPEKLVLTNMDEWPIVLIVAIPLVAVLIYFLYSGVLFWIFAIVGAIFELLFIYGFSRGLTITFD